MKAENLFAILTIVVLSVGLISYSSQYVSANIILTGTGMPSSTLGSNGDIYTDISNGHYYQKNNAAWTSITSATAQASINTPPANLQGYSNTQGYCSGMMTAQGYCTNSQGGMTTSNYFTQSNNGPNVSSCTPNTMNPQGYNCEQSGTLTNTVQPNTGSNIFCSTGIMNSQGYCMNTQGGIVPPSYSTANSFCSTGMINSQGYCINPQGLVTTPGILDASPDYLSRQTITSSPSTLNPQVYLSNEAVTRMQPANSLQGAISSYGYMISQNATNSQAGIIPSNYSSIKNSTGANIYSCTQGAMTPQGFLCTQGILNSQGGKLSSPSYSVQSNSTTSYWCGTGIMNAQGLCVNPQGKIITPSYTKSQNVTNSAGYLSPQVYLSNKGVTRSQPTNSLQGTISGFINSGNSQVTSPNATGSNAYSCMQGTLTSTGFLCTQGMMNSQGMNSQGGVLGSQSSNSSNGNSGLQTSTNSSSGKQVAIISGAGSGGQNGSCVVANNCFNPSVLTVSAGDTVTWTNNDNVSHTITSGNPTDAQAGTLFDKSISPGQKVSVTFNDNGTVNYFCKLHPWIKGQVIVGMPSTTTSPGTTSPGTTSPGTTSPGTTSPGTTSPGY